MKRLFLAVAVLALSACGTVAPGTVGILVNNYGSQKGVQDFPIRTGVVFYNPITTDLYRFPTYQQNKIWTAAKDEGSPENESITVNSIEGATINFDVQTSVEFIADSVPKIFVKFRKDEEHIMQVFVRSLMRDAFSHHASRMKVTDIFGNQKQAFQDSSLIEIRAKLDPMGIKMSQLSIIGEIRVDGNVKASINAVLAAAQAAIEAGNKVKQAEAEANQMIQTARGDSLSAVIRASGQAHANALLQQSLTSAVLQSKALDKWDGVLPTVTSGAVPFINVTPTRPAPPQDK